MGSFDAKRTVARHQDAGASGEDPLVELARIVSGDESLFREPAASARRTTLDEPFAAELEHELFNELSASFASAETQSHDRRPDAAHEMAGEPPHGRLAEPEEFDMVDPASYGRAGDHPAGEDGDAEFDAAFAEAFSADRMDGEEGGRSGFGPVPPALLGERAHGGSAKRIASWSRGRVLLLGAVSVIALGSGVAAFVGLPGGTTATGEVPIIRAEAGAFKTYPEAATAAAEPQTGQAVFDRVAGRAPSAEEQLVDRREAPQEVEAALDTTPALDEGVSAPDGEEPEQDVITASISADEAAPKPLEARLPTAPRRVQTVRIGADGSIITPQAQPEGLDIATLAAPKESTAPAAPEQGLGAATEGTAPAAPPLDSALPRPRPQAAAAPAVAALAPEAEPPESAAPAPAAQPAELVAAPAPEAAVASGYVVQLSSQKTEDQAKAAFASLQKKFGAVLGGQQPNIQRADLGSKGTYFRVRVGPLASQAEAADLCRRLKSAGGSCFVTR